MKEEGKKEFWLVRAWLGNHGADVRAALHARVSEVLFVLIRLARKQRHPTLTFSLPRYASIPYAILCPVYFLRYPNPQATHVLSVDVLSRDIVRRPLAPSDGDERAPEGEGREGGPSQRWRHVLKTTRLILKRGTLPKWAPRGIIKNAESWVLEETEMDLDIDPPSQHEERQVASSSGPGAEGFAREFKVWTRNLDHTHVMAVTERTTFREHLNGLGAAALKGEGANSGGFSSYRSCFDITSDIAFFHNRIERFGLNRVVTHADTSRVGLLETQKRFLAAMQGASFQTQAWADKDRGEGGHAMGEANAVQTRPSKKQRLALALRPPFLDGDFVGPIARMKMRLAEVRGWWGGLVRGGTAGLEGQRARDDAASSSAFGSASEQNLTPTEQLRKRFFFNLQRGSNDSKKDTASPQDNHTRREGER